MSDGRDALCDRIGYAFRNAALLDDALTHRSARGRHNERLEFLGDGLLNFVVAEALFRNHPDLEEGDLTRLRASLVRAETLAELARDVGLGDCLVLGAGELKSGGYRRDSILGDALEALFGAVYLDGGYDAARTVIAGLFGARLTGLPDLEALKDAKTRLQEWLQARGLPRPEYELVSETGEVHRREFRVRCTVDGAAGATEGVGSSRRGAEQQAAERMLSELVDG